MKMDPETEQKAGDDDAVYGDFEDLEMRKEGEEEDSESESEEDDDDDDEDEEEEDRTVEQERAENARIKAQAQEHASEHVEEVGYRPIISTRCF
jgi:hypothetical protein